MKLRIKGGPHCKNMEVVRINEDGSETEIKNISRMKISEFNHGELVTVEMTFINVELQLELDCEVKSLTE